MTTNRLWKKEQSWWGEMVVSVPKADVRTVYRMTIRRNAYDDQSWGRVEVYSPTSGWFEVLTRSIGELPIRKASYGMDEDRVKDDMKRSLLIMFDEAKTIHEGTV